MMNATEAVELLTKELGEEISSSTIKSIIEREKKAKLTKTRPSFKALDEPKPNQWWQASVVNLCYPISANI